MALSFKNQKISVEDFVQVLLRLPDAESESYLTNHYHLLDQTESFELAQALKNESQKLMASDISACLKTAKLISLISNHTGNPTYKALSLLAQGNAFIIGLGEYQKGINLLDQASDIYGEQGLKVNQAKTQIGKIWALASLGQYEEALKIGEWASAILNQNNELLDLAKMMSNMASINGRLGRDNEALELFKKARLIYTQLGNVARFPLLRVNTNLAITLRHLGKFQESIAISKTVIENYKKHQPNQIVALARAKQCLAITYFILGQYNEALVLLDKVRDNFVADHRQRHAMLTELFISDCLLQLRRFHEVLTSCKRVKTHFNTLGTKFEIGRALLNEARAYIGLKQFGAAEASLSEAQNLFLQEGNLIEVARTKLHTASVYLAQNQNDKSLELALEAAQVFQDQNLSFDQARSYLIAARASLSNQQIDYARNFIEQASTIGNSLNIPTLSYQVYYLQGLLSVRQKDYLKGIIAFEKALENLEFLYGRLMLEYRADFIADKEELYEEAVNLSLEMKQPQRGLEISERAKSRALQDLIAHRLELRLEARNQADESLVTEIHHLRAKRDQLYRHWENDVREGKYGSINNGMVNSNLTEQSFLTFEKRITEAWHKLLMRNADYARDAIFWQVRTEPIQPYLDEETILLEYFVIHNKIVVFLVTSLDIDFERLDCTQAQIQSLLHLFRLNLATTSQIRSGQLTSVIKNATGILAHLHKQLIAPFKNKIRPYKRLIIVPHGPLHYLPFQALHDGETYLIENHEISYLPGSSLLRYCREIQSGEGDSLIIGHSYDGRLQHTLQEARAISAILPSILLTENDATTVQLRAKASNSRIIHIAAHGDFRPDNPLFSGLALADGWLTTLDVFNLRLQASLVTLSACQTGRSIVGGGDELLGLMRAFLSAGASSLITTLWSVEDHSTAEIMQSFYGKLAAGRRKGEALRMAQLQLLKDNTQKYAHPYFWAPFSLIGDAEVL